MTKILCLAAIATAMLAGGAEAAPICLSTYDMLETQPAKDGASILFKMRDGSVWRNDLHGPCRDLRFDGFVWQLRNSDSTVCENIQSLRVLRSGQVCMLGKFTQVGSPRAEQHVER